MERRPPPRAPEVLIRRVDVPGRGQFNVGCSQLPNCRHRPHPTWTSGNAILIVLEVRVAVRVLEDVLQRTLGVVDLHLEVVARADHRRIQLEAAADRPAPLLLRVTTNFWVKPGRRGYCGYKAH